MIMLENDIEFAGVSQLEWYLVIDDMMYLTLLNDEDNEIKLSLDYDSMDSLYEGLRKYFEEEE